MTEIDSPSKPDMRFVANLFLLAWLLMLAMALDVVWGLSGTAINPKAVRIFFACLLCFQAYILQPLIIDIAKPPLATSPNIVRHLVDGRHLMLRSAFMLFVWVLLLQFRVVSAPASPSGWWLDRIILLAIVALPTAAWHLQFSDDRGEDSRTVNLRLRDVRLEYGWRVAYVYVWWALLTPWLLGGILGLKYYVDHHPR